MALGFDLAEDVAATKLARRRGMKVRLVGRPVEQPIGKRRLADVWSRQWRWARIRRLGFLRLFLPEILLGTLMPAVAVTCLVAAGAVPFLVLPAYLCVWYGAEWVMARLNRWPAGPLDMLAMPLRDAMLPLLYIWSFASDKIQWRGAPIEASHASDVRPAGH